ncbi:Hint domain-containing protein [Falsihalocynthiibacter arcticus]|uniref:Hedgehog/Intein (Hint) domain-containing protein n=1 Tax=Falsihalocynthiibacter arcticus TaxID=1579316 RepID=A0A126UVX5_9RHOB|nr:Hint domain-containing protein [Falsihalocynthiibacter arcticus]AML50223.1 hypothetical protein RC74_02130 [Falsihalocynthiibacter arcticus]
MFGLKKPIRRGAHRTAEASGSYGGGHFKRPRRTGMISGTRVATQFGWRDVTKIVPGDRVLTLDGGLQVVKAVRHEQVAQIPGDSLLKVPSLALGNRETVYLLATQDVMIESDAAEDLFGDPFALIPALALEGLRGIQRVAATEELRVVAIEFAQDQVVFANIGALFLCPRSEQANMVEVAELDLLTYDALPMSEARLLAEAYAMENIVEPSIQEYVAA